MHETTTEVILGQRPIVPERLLTPLPPLWRRPHRLFYQFVMGRRRLWAFAFVVIYHQHPPVVFSVRRWAVTDASRLLKVIGDRFGWAIDSQRSTRTSY